MTYARESVNVAYVAGKSARWYVKNMVGGLAKMQSVTDVNVVYANGTVKDFKWSTVLLPLSKGKARGYGRCRSETCEGGEG